jgi:cell division protein FtsN
MFYVNRATQEIGDNHDVVKSSINSKAQSVEEEEVEFDFYKLLPEGDRASDSVTLGDGATQAKNNTVYFIQVAALSHAREADNLKARLAMSGFESRIQSFETVSGKLFHRVRIGPYQDAGEVVKIKAELAEFNFDVTVIKVTNDN